ncbi:MAG TPA: agmatinase family protein [Dehalococcoidia bacterium]|nr:agmatinase family protein [Dehalococcoidia bacterium]
MPLHDKYGPEARYAVEAEALIPTTRRDEEVKWALEMGLQGADSIVDRSIPTFSRGELPHFAGINTFLKSHYLEDVKRCGEFNVAVLGAPFDGGTTYRSGTRFGPQGIRKISALYGPYSFELGVDLRESLTVCDLGDIFTIPANIEKTFDQISKATAHVFESGAFPIVLGGDHSIGYPTVRGVAERLNGKLGIIHFDRHVDTQETDLDERMHTTPWFHATDIPNVPAKNLVQIGIGGWQAPRPGVKVGRERGTTIMTVTDCVEMGIEEAAKKALEIAWDGVDAVWLSFDVDCLDAAFVPGTGWPEPGGFLPREVLKFIQLISEMPLAGMEIVECSPPYDNAEITSLIATRVICDTLGCLVRAGHLGKRVTV